MRKHGKKSMTDEKMDEKERKELKKIYNHYFDEENEIMRNFEGSYYIKIEKYFSEKM